MDDDPDEFQLKKRLIMSLAVLKQYSWLLDSYILDFFVNRHFQKLPKSWVLHLRGVDMVELSKFLDFQNKKLSGVWPLSLTTLHFLVRYLCLSRIPNKSLHTSNQNELDTSHAELEAQNVNNNQFDKNHFILNNPKLKNLFVKHVKPKKRYEILEMARVIANMAENLGVDCVVDVGSGLGHLSRILGYGYGLKVLSLESYDKFSEQAEQFDKELEITASKHLSEVEMEVIVKRRPVHVQKTITCDISSEDFLQLVDESLNIKNIQSRFGIIGLHPCGNLASKLLKIFTDCDAAKFIDIVGCCYHKITVSSENSFISGFPISNYCRNKSASLSYEARSLACHALETYCKRLERNDYDHLKIHCYRAALEYIINKNWPNLRRSPLNNVKHGPDLTFKLYCQNALRKLNLSVNDEDINSSEVLQILSEWTDVVLYYSLRLLLAPLVETVVLIDRMLYIMENGYACDVCALFEPEISPRNLVLIGKKNPFPKILSNISDSS